MAIVKMALQWQAVVLLVHSALIINCLPTESPPIDVNEQYRPQIWSILDFLNSNPHRSYNYNFGYFANAQKKTEDVTDLEIEVDVECLNKEECSKDVLICRGYVEYFPAENRFSTLPNVVCQKKNFDVTVRPQSYVETTKESESEESPEIIEEVFTQKKKPCSGCLEELSKNAEGVDTLINTALSHIESEKSRKYLPVQIIKLQSQVVLGVKYILLLEVVPTVCASNLNVLNAEMCPIDEQATPEICEISFLQKPWISRDKPIISNNCTVSQEYVPPLRKTYSRNDIDNEIDVNNEYQKPVDNQNVAQITESSPNFDKMAESDTLEEFLTPAKIAEIESILIPTDSTKEKEIETTKSGVDNLQLGVEDIPSMQTSTDSFYQGDNIDEQISDVLPSFYQGENIDGQTTHEIGVMPKDEQRAIKSTTRRSGCEYTGTFRELSMLRKRYVAPTQSSSSSEENSKSSEEKAKPGEALPVRRRRNVKSEQVDSTSSEESHEEDKKQRNLSSHSSEETVIDEENVAKMVDAEESLQDRKKRDANDNEDSSSSSSEEDKKVEKNDNDNKKQELKKDDDDNDKIDNLNDKKGDNKNNDDDSSSSSASDGDGNNKKRKVRAVSEDSNSSKSNEDQKDRQKRGAKDSSSSSSSSSSDDDDNNDDDDDNNNNNDDKHDKRHKKSNLKQSKKDDKNDKDNDNDKDDSSSSSSSSSDDDDNNNKNRRRREVSTSKHSTENQLVEKLADYAVSTFNDANHNYEVLEILKVLKIELEGAVYHLSLRVGVSKCSDSESCYLSGEKYCKVKMHVSKSQHIKMLQSHCHNLSDKNRTDRKFKRDVLVGGQSDASNDENIKSLAKITLLQLDSKSSHDNKYKIVEILEAKKQVVSGMRYDIKAKIILSDCPKSAEKDSELCGELKESPPKTCRIIIWDQPWLENGRKTNVTCGESENHYFESNSRSRRQLPGGQMDASKEEKIKILAKSVLVQLDSQSSHDNKYKVIEILEALKQVVSGMLYNIKAKIALSDCPKSSDKDAELCGELKETAPKICHIQVWDQPWLKNGLKTNVTCGESENYYFTSESRRPKRDIMVGSPINAMDDTNIINLAKMSLLKLDAESPHENKYKIVKILEAVKQIVSGVLYRIKAEVILSDCSKSFPLVDTEYCNADPNMKKKICNIVIFNQQWISSEHKITINCDENKNHLLGQDDHDVQFSSFKSFMKEHNKSYKNKEEMMFRFKIFKRNLKVIQDLNENELGTATYDVTKFTDLTKEEFKQYTGYRPDLRNENDIGFAQAKIPDITLPTEFDWRKHNAVAEVKDQGQCGSCWAFSVTGNIEGQYAIKHGKLLEFSEQELVDCDKTDDGCNGGLMDNAYKAIEEMGGIELEKDYPYDAENEKCHFNRSLSRAQLSGALNISQDETEMAKWLVKNGPISIAINANAMQFYVGGVSHPPKFLCSPSDLDHGVLIVGYGVRNNKFFNKKMPYWIVKNSWGPRWGEQGYYRVYRGGGTCGLNQTPSSAIVE